MWQIICIALPRQETPLLSRVLIADTDAALRQQLYARLLDLDVFSDCASNAADALAKLEESNYNLVIADVGLPDGGIEKLLARIATFPESGKRRPIVLVLASRPESTRTLDVDVVQIVLRRPVDMHQLIDLIRSCLRSAAAPRRDRREGEADHARS